jgi:CubicO group peptidase (beta-lactamase class C family)
MRCPERLGRIAAWAAVLSAAIVAGVLLWRAGEAGSPASQLEMIVRNEVADSPAVKSCVLAVVKGDGSFQWFDAAGTANDAARVVMTNDTPIFIASVTKLYTATVVMLLAERGQLALEDTIAKYLPQAMIQGIHVYAGEEFSDQITIGDLLSHRSGIADYYSDKAADGKSAFDLFLEDPTRHWTVDETIGRARSLKAQFPPGMATAYSDTNFQLLGKIIQSVTGQPLHTIYEGLLFRPLGLERTWLVGYRPERLGTPGISPADIYLGDRNITLVRSNGSYWADGGIISTASEMIKFLKALKEGKLVRPETLLRMHDWHHWQFPMQYGYGTMYFSLPFPLAGPTGLPAMWGHSGTTGSFLYYVPKSDLYIAGTINQTESKFAPFGLIRKAIAALR